MKMLVTNFFDTIEIISKAIHNAKLLSAHQIACKNEYMRRVDEAHNKRSRLYKVFFYADYDKFVFFSRHENNVEILQKMLDRLIPLQAETQNEFIFEEHEIAVITKYAFLDNAKLQELYISEQAYWEN